MGLHLYCVTPVAHVAGDVVGLNDAPVRTIVVDGLALWVSEMDAPASASVEAAQRHHAVVEAAMATVTPVPLRFGQWLPDEAALRVRAAARSAEWRATLADLDGTQEYTVRILDPAGEVPARDVHPRADGSGRAYLEAVAARRSDRERQTSRGRTVAARIEAAVADHMIRMRVDALMTTHGLATAAFLVRRRDATAFTRALGAALAAHPELRFLTSGPWPPWSFAA